MERKTERMIGLFDSVKMKRIIKDTTLGIGFCAGVLLPGSDFDGFPWINILGLCILGAVVWIARHESRRCPWR